MKKYLYLLLFVWLPSLVTALPVEFRIDTLFATPGDSIVIPLRVRNFQNAGSATLYIQYNSSVLSFGRALDWNTELQGSIFMASAVNSSIAVVWADINSASISDDIFVKFKFRFLGGSTNLTFASNSEVTDIWGNLLDPAPMYFPGLVRQLLTVTTAATPVSICTSQTSTLSMQITGGQGSTSFYWYSDPPGFTSTLSSPVVSPTATTTYFARVFDIIDTVTSSVTVNVYPEVAPDPVTNMQPLDLTSNLTFPVQFSWSPAANTSGYTIRIWEQANPTVSYTIQLATSINYALNTILQAGKTYEWRIVTTNPCYETDGPVQSFTMAQLPDLVVESVLVPPTAFSGQSISVSWIIKNQGLGGTSGTVWNDRIYLSFDQELQTNVDHYLGTFTNLSALNPQESYTRTLTTTLPQGISGNYYLIVTTGNNITYPEAVTINNMGINAAAMQVSLSPTPDLQVTQVLMADNIFSGQSLLVSWTVSNSGEAPTAQTQWRDRVYFSQDTFFTASSTILGTFLHTGALAIGESYTLSPNVTIPPNILGTFYIYVVTDVFNQVYEHALENNNRKRSLPLTVFLTPPADLVPTQLSKPAFASNREIITVSYTVFNDGANTAINEGGWTDSIYISNQAVLNTTQAKRIGFYKRIEPLQPGLSYSQNVQCLIPSGLSGPHYIHVFSDVSQQIFEFDQEENNIKTSSIIDIRNPDLTAASIQLPDSAWSGTPIQISYYQKNNGSGNLPASLLFRDSLLISTSSVYDSAQMTGFSVKNFSGTPIPAGDSLLQSYSVTLPNGLNGDYYVYVFTDKRNNVTEGNGENNNISRSLFPLHISLTPWPDLIVESVIPTMDTVNAGSILEIACTIKNIGPGFVPSALRKDLVCLSASPFGPVNFTLFKTKSFTTTLLPDSSYSFNTQLVVPKNFTPGAYFIYVFTDSVNTVYEHTDEVNNILRSDPVWIEPYPPTNLTLASLSCPDSLQSGFPSLIEWSVKNLSLSSSYTFVWEDSFYLSDDQSYDPSEDVKVGGFAHYGYLAGNATYSNSINFTIPNGISGNYYLLGVTDYNNSNQDPQYSNNIRIRSDINGTPLPVFVGYTPAPDLVVSEFTAPSVLTSGQPFSVNWEVRNQGPGESRPNTWTDKIYLSTNTTFDQSDVLLGGLSHTSGLLPDSSYAFSYTVTLPFYANGNYVLLLLSDANNQVFEAGQESNNIASRAIQAVRPAPGDLIVHTIIPPIDQNAGELTEIFWTNQNIGINPVNGSMRDIVYLSKDSIWDSDDIFFASMQSNISLGNGMTSQRSATARLENVTPGDWYVLVRTNVINSIYESDFTNNTTASDAPFRIVVPVLSLDTWTPDTLFNSQPLYYQVDIPSQLIGETLRIRLKGDSVYGNNEIYLRYGEVPSRSTFDYGFSDPGSGNQEILVPYLGEGTYYLLVYGNSLNGTEQSVQLYANIMDFEILSVEQNTGGNNGEVTVKLSGSKFSQDMQVYIHIGERKVYASSLQYINSTRVFPTFNLLEVPTGLYSVTATKNCDGTATLEDSFEVVEGTEDDLQVNLVAPSASGPGAIVPVRVEFTNIGNTNLINPSRTVINLMQGPVAQQYSGLNSAGSEVELFFEEVGGPSGILRPGAKGSLIIYSKSGTAQGNIVGVMKND